MKNALNSVKRNWLIFLLAALALIGISMLTFGQAKASNNIEVISGTVRYVGEEGGFWGVVGDDGKRYEPIHMPTELRRNGLKIELTATVFKNHYSIRTWGILIEVLDYKVIH